MKQEDFVKQLIKDREAIARKIDVLKGELRTLDKLIKRGTGK